MRVLSLGAGVQSSALLLLGEYNRIEIDHAVFADTGDEPAAVYEWLELLTGLTSIPIHTVRHPSGMSLSDWSTRGDEPSDVLGVPLHLQKPDGTRGMARRSCTREFKIAPVRRKLRELNGGKPLTQLIGISVDEWQRMRTSPVQYVTNEYPLVDMRWNRNDCLQFVHQQTGHTPPRSACVYCPYRSDAEWRRMTETELGQAAAYETRVNDLNASLTRGSYEGKLTVHRSGPIADADFRGELEGQLSMLDECEGMCGT